MNKLGKLRQWIISMIGILPLVLSLVNIQPAFADTSTSDISVTITADRRTVRLGQNITYTVRATNLGPDTANFVDVVHNLSPQLSPISLTCDRGISPDGPFCEYSVIEPGETVVSILVATPNPDAPHRRHLVTKVTIDFETTDTFDPHLRNNHDAVSVRWVGRFH